jgi:hypothetical protein
MYLQIRIFRHQYSTERICAAIVDITTIQCALYYKLGEKYSARPPVYAMWTVVPDIYNAFKAPHIQTSIFNWSYLRCYWRYRDNATRVILQTWSQIKRTSSSLRNVKCGPGHMQCIYSSAYSVLQYSTERICAAIGDITTIQFMLYYKLGAKYSAHPPVFAMWTLNPVICNVFTAPRIQASIFNWTYLRCYSR